MRGAAGPQRTGEKMTASAIAGVSRSAIRTMIEREHERFAFANPRSRELAARSARHWLHGVPMHWMLDWGTPFPLFVAAAKGATFTDADGHGYADFCLGDTGAMFGHSPAPVAEAVRRQAERGFTSMLPSEDAPIVGELLARALRPALLADGGHGDRRQPFRAALARWLTGRPKILVFNGCYHGTVDETFVRLKNGRPIHRPGLIGQAVDLTDDTEVVEFNDVAALEAALAPGDVACVITEPALTNIGMVLPQPGFHDALRAATRRTGTLLVIDETHSHQHRPRRLYARVRPGAGFLRPRQADRRRHPLRGLRLHGRGRGTADEAMGDQGAGPQRHRHHAVGNPLAMAAMRANLEQVMTPAAYDHMLGLSGAAGARAWPHSSRSVRLPWHVSNLGARAEFVCAPRPPKNGTEAAAAMHGDLEHAIHIYLLNRGVLIAPFHNMTLVCPATTAADVDRLLDALRDCLGELLS